MLIQQGDVLIQSISEIKGKKLNHKTLAKGEATGHHHIITEGDAELYEHEGTMFLRVNSDNATLTHQEHNIVTIPKGDYIVKKVREVNWVDEEIRKVRD